VLQLSTALYIPPFPNTHNKTARLSNFCNSLSSFLHPHITSSYEGGWKPLSAVPTVYDTVSLQSTVQDRLFCLTPSVCSLQYKTDCSVCPAASTQHNYNQTNFWATFPGEKKNAFYGPERRYILRTKFRQGIIWPQRCPFCENLCVKFNNLAQNILARLSLPLDKDKWN
jgi:hypothetical protein